ncbi:MAG: RNA methyltransferase [Caldimicrobium sp.]
MGVPRKLIGEEILWKWRKNRPEKAFPIVAILDNLRSAYNVGSVFRTACCAYIEKIVLTGITARPPHPGIEKTALGTTELIPWEYEESTLSVVEKYKSRGYKIAALELTEKSIPLQSLQKSDFPLALIIGNEVEGVSEAVLEASDVIIEIPLFGEKESLNVAVAFGIAIFLLLEKIKKT